jgi:SAM-dependent methyltransferase
MFKIKNKLHRGFRWVLFYLFRFDRWHVSSLGERRYAQDIIAYLNSLPDSQRNRIVEIGCGLGDLIRNVNFKNKYGLDCDIHALKAARFLSFLQMKHGISFVYSVFPDTHLDGYYDTIIMVNWIHNIPPDILKGKIKEYFSQHLVKNGNLVIDTVQSSGYKYNHSIDYLVSGITCQPKNIGCYDNGREVFVIQNTGDGIHT